MKKQLAALLLALILLFGLMPSPVMAAGAAGEPEAPEGNELSLSIRINCVNHPEHSGNMPLTPNGNYYYDKTVHFDTESGRYYIELGLWSGQVTRTYAYYYDYAKKEKDPSWTFEHVNVDDTERSKEVRLYYNAEAGTWAADTEPVVMDVRCEDEVPTADEVRTTLTRDGKDGVDVVDSDNVTSSYHSGGRYNAIEGLPESFTVSMLEKIDGFYYGTIAYMVKLDATVFIKKYTAVYDTKYLRHVPTAGQLLTLDWAIYKEGGIWKAKAIEPYDYKEIQEWNPFRNNVIYLDHETVPSITAYVFLDTFDSAGEAVTLTDAELARAGLAYNQGGRQVSFGDVTVWVKLTGSTVDKTSAEYAEVVAEVENGSFFLPHSSSEVFYAKNKTNGIAWGDLKLVSGEHYGFGVEAPAYHLEGALTFCKVTFDANAGTDPVENMPASGGYYYSGAKMLFPTEEPTRTGYEFSHWEVDGKPFSLADTNSVTVTKDVTYTAVWEPNEYTVTFNTHGGTAVAPQTVTYRSTAAKPDDPTRIGYHFAGWYTDEACTKEYSFSAPVTGDLTLHAGWTRITYPSNPGTAVKKHPTFNTSDHFAYVQGYPDGTVKPGGSITRAETAAILFRLMSDDSRTAYYAAASNFRDVSADSWYSVYAATLDSAGVITDSADGLFRPNEAITRAELAAMLVQFAAQQTAAGSFSDVAASHWAARAIALCAKLGWINGYPDGTFRPDENVSRAELMAMLNRATGRAPKSADALLKDMRIWKDNANEDAWYYLDVQEATNSHSYTVSPTERWTALNAGPDWAKYE